MLFAMKLALSLLAFSAAAFAQQPPTLMTQAQTGFTRSHDYVLRSAIKMPADAFSFQPTPQVRTFGALIGHIVETNYYFCSTMKGEENPGKDIEKTKTTKDALVQAVKDVQAYCEPVVKSMGVDTKVKNGTRELPGLGVVFNMNAHTLEHYGNMTTYMRIKGIVPASSEN